MSSYGCFYQSFSRVWVRLTQNVSLLNIAMAPA
jgi:hypothetical protein